MSDLFNRVADELIADAQYLPLPEYDKGVLDCIEGKFHDMTKSLEYTRGFGEQYAKEQQRSAGHE